MSDPDLYPDLRKAGGLSAAFNVALSALESRLTAKDLPEDIRFVNYARIAADDRFSQVYIAAEERLFLIDFWRAGVQYANAQTDSLALSARLIDSWVGKACSLDELCKLPAIRLRPGAKAFDAGNEVNFAWERYLSDDDDLPELRELFRLAAAVPKLRQLFPFTSLHRLCFSRCTGYPYVCDLPYLCPCEDGTYEARDAKNRLLYKGTAAEAVQAATAILPADCGPARPGTADDYTAT
ncbi:hypothetical protein DTL42_17655 [Bremerella cremea]|uniref:Uncharacterized protein n=1 Tax=Bremerella cremea TaxID=1031537 RepID=A0A368KNF3_9BACT|nr:DUF6193 family natural product biosynthesis protein [Bremerella cremea]RCS44744.1 hypothetical protein DTL42_17655 [Bremerella cremea]